MEIFRNTSKSMNKYSFKDNVAISFLENDAVILDIDRGKYIHINGTAASICKILNQNSSINIDEIYQLLSNEYKISKGLHKDISEFIDKLTSLDLIIIV